MKLKLLAGAALAALAVAGAASAEQATGWYGAIDLGSNTKSDYKARSQGDMVDGGPFVYNISTKDNVAGFARLGYRYSPNWRVELEGGIRPGDVDGAIGFPRTYAGGNLLPTALCNPGNGARTASSACGHPSGIFNQTSLMVNLIYDIMPESRFHPFVGVGAGIDSVKARMIGQFSTSPAGEIDNLSITGNDTAGAYQALAGLAWALNDRLTLDLTYRYMGVDSIGLNSISSSAQPGWQPGKFSGKFDNQSLTIGLRWAFGTTPPPPPPPPPPPVYEAREFIVYFEFDKSDLTSDAQAVVSAAADYAKAGNAARVVIVGYTDTSGSVAYNLKLSERRAKTVADALAGLGVDASKLAVDWKGKSDPAVATGDGVKEPLNRRATVDITF